MSGRHASTAFILIHNLAVNRQTSLALTVTFIITLRCNGKPHLQCCSALKMQGRCCDATNLSAVTSPARQLPGPCAKKAKWCNRKMAGQVGLVITCTNDRSINAFCLLSVTFLAAANPTMPPSGPNHIPTPNYHTHRCNHMLSKICKTKWHQSCLTRKRHTNTAESAAECVFLR